MPHTFSTRDVLGLMAVAVVLGIAATNIWYLTNSDGGSEAVRADVRQAVTAICGPSDRLQSISDPNAAASVYRCDGARDVAMSVASGAEKRALRL